MEQKALIEEIIRYKEQNPDFQKILEQLNIDEKAYFDALVELTAQEPILLSPFSNSSYLGN